MASLIRGSVNEAKTASLMTFSNPVSPPSSGLLPSGSSPTTPAVSTNLALPGTGAQTAASSEPPASSSESGGRPKAAGAVENLRDGPKSGAWLSMARSENLPPLPIPFKPALSLLKTVPVVPSVPTLLESAAGAWPTAAHPDSTIGEARGGSGRGGPPTKIGPFATGPEGTPSPPPPTAGGGDGADLALPLRLVLEPLPFLLAPDPPPAFPFFLSWAAAHALMRDSLNVENSAHSSTGQAWSSGQGAAWVHGLQTGHNVCKSFLCMKVLQVKHWRLGGVLGKEAGALGTSISVTSILHYHFSLLCIWKQQKGKKCVKMRKY